MFCPVSVRNRFKGIIFDFNGTLVWDTRFHERAWIAFSREVGHPIDRDTYYREIHGKTTKHILERLLGHEVSQDEIAQMSREKERLYRSICLQNPETFVLAPGVEDFLDELSEHAVPMTIATASEIENVEFFIEQFSLKRWFDPAAIVYDDGTVQNKPAPDIYVKAAEHIGIAPPELVIVEDSYFGIAAAQAAGCGQVIVTGQPTAQHAELRKMEGLSQFIEDFSEIDRTLFW